MIQLPSLFPHQETLRDKTRAALAKHGRVILCAGCGVGKTRTSKWILGSSANRQPKENQSGMSLFAVQGRPLVRNASDSFNQDPALHHGIVMSQEKAKWGARTHVASIDTLLSWFIKDGEYDTSITFDLIVYDETDSHFQKLKKFLEHHDAYRKEIGKHPAYVIGLTATPQAKGLADVYREIVQGPSTEWLIENKFLAPFRYFRATQGQLGLLVKKGDRFTEESEAAAMDGLAGDLVRDWKRFAEGRPTVGFFPRRSHAKDAQEQLEAAGVRVAYVDCDTSDSERARIFWELNNWQIDYLCNVDLVGRGTDIPAIACVQLCVAIGSIGAFIQKLGRGSRMDDGVREDGENVPAKIDCLVLDHGGNIARHGFFEDERMWSLDQSKAEVGSIAVRPTIECPKCNAIYRGGKCRKCGYAPSQKERKAQGLTFDGTELKEVTKKERKRKVLGPEELMVKVLYSAGRSGRTWKQALGMYFGIARQQGTKYRVPKTVNVGEHRYFMVPYRSHDSVRRVSELYPFTVEGGNHSGRYLHGERVR